MPTRRPKGENPWMARTFEKVRGGRWVGVYLGHYATFDQARAVEIDAKIVVLLDERRHLVLPRESRRIDLAGHVEVCRGQCPDCGHHLPVQGAPSPRAEDREESEPVGT